MNLFSTLLYSILLGISERYMYLYVPYIVPSLSRFAAVCYQVPRDLAAAQHGYLSAACMHRIAYVHPNDSDDDDDDDDNQSSLSRFRFSYATVLPNAPSLPFLSLTHRDGVLTYLPTIYSTYKYIHTPTLVSTE